MKRFEGIGKNMMVADKYFKMYLKDALKPYGLNAADGIILLMMYRNDSGNSKGFPAEQNGKTQDELIKEIHYDKGVMTRTMKELEGKGFVMRNQHPADSRSFLFSLTEKGTEFKHTLVRILREWNSVLLEGIDSDELERTEAVLEMMSKNAALFYNGKSKKNNK